MVFGIGESVEDIRVLRWRLARNDRPVYLDAYGDVDLAAPDRFDFAWTEVGRDRVSDGRNPMVEIAGELHLGLDTTTPVAATIAFRIDDAVEGGRVVLVEPVAESGQAITELRVAYARVGDLILVRVLPYRETVERFYVYNRLNRQMVRDDPLGVNARILPGEQGVIFPGGYQLTNGEARTFATDAAPVTAGGGRPLVPAWNFHARHLAPNGEDVLYAYHDVVPGRYLLCGYNVVTKTMANPIVAAGYAVFDDGVIVCLRDADEPSRVHTVSVYTSPFCLPAPYAPPVPSDSFFGRIGDPELVAVLGECFALSRDVEQVSFVPAVFEALVTRTRKLLDTQAWLDDADARGLGRLLLAIRRTAGDILDELAAVNAARKAAHDAHRPG